MVQSKDFPDSFYRVTIKGICVNDGKILMNHDFVNPERPIWELPGGGLDFGEDPREALVREVKEEMGLEVTSISEKPVYMWTARRENARNMDWFYVLILAYKLELKDFNITPSEECRAIRFLSKEELTSVPDEEMTSQMMPLRTLFDPKDFE